MLRILVPLTALLGFGFIPGAQACSVVPGYRVPTNLELADRAEAIFVGKVENGKGEPSPGAAAQVRVISVLKGSVPESNITLRGFSLAPDRFAVLSNPYELQGAHPLSYIGGCVRYMLPLGTTALFFVQREKGNWVPAGYPFARIAEDVPDADAPWVRLVALYVRATALPESERRAMLEAERDRLRAMPADPVSRLMAADIDRQLAGPNRPWNTIMDEQLKQMRPKD